MRTNILLKVVLTLLVVGIAYWTLQNWNAAPDASWEPNTSQSDAAHSVISVGPEATVRDDVDPDHDTWEAETIHASLKQQLKAIAQSIETGRPTAELKKFATDSFTSKHFRETKRSYHDEKSVSVYRPIAKTPAELEHEIAKFVANQIGEIQQPRCTFKVAGIENLDTQTNTKILVEFYGHEAGGLEQVNATWKCTWTKATPPLIVSVEVESFERIKRDGRPLFEDVTQAALSHVVGYESQFLRGIDHWAQRLPRIDDMHIYGHHGIAVADINNDGWDDIYVCDGGGLPNRVFLGTANGVLRDHSSESKVNWLESTTSALLLDLDGDGDKDLFAATVAAIVVASNNGKGVFEVRNAITGFPEAHTLSAADPDNDGDLDVYVCSYGASGGTGSSRGYEASAPWPYNDANNGGPNALLQNNGNFQFANVTKEVGLDNNNRRFSFASSWEDFDQDGDVDLYVANDFGRNNLYVNEGGQFKDEAASAGVEDMAGGMSVSWGDFNRDGSMDIYVGNMFSAAGKRVAFQRRFTEKFQGQTEALQRMARGNTLFASNANGTFSDLSESMGVTMGRWAWGSRFADINNDGWDDLVVANGYFTSEQTDDL